MAKGSIMILLVAIIFAACTANQPLPSTQPLEPAFTQTSQATPTNTSLVSATAPHQPIYTLSPATPVASCTPASLVPQEQALIAYQRAASPDSRLVLLNPSDGNSWDFSFPAGSTFATPFLAGLSPDAHYFVYYEGGKVGEYGQFIAESTQLAMHVYDLREDNVVFSTSLLSLEFPQDLKPLVEMTEDDYWRVENDRQAKLDYMFATMQQTLLDHLRTVAWSPDGSLLAFASQNPGPSSDLYFFGPFSGKAWRVTSELGHVYDLTWAPGSITERSSSAIALQTALYQTQATHITTYILSRLGIPQPSLDNTYFYGWLDPDKLLFRRIIDFGDPFFHLEVMSVFKDSLTPLWEPSFDAFAITPDLSSFLVSSSQPNNPGESAGLFLKLRDSETPLRLSESAFWKVAYWGSENFAFAASAPATGIFDAPQTGGTYGISEAGTLILIDAGNWYLLPAPDTHLLAAYGPNGRLTGLRVFAGDGKLFASLSEANITCLQWDATSSQLAYQVEQRLFLWQPGDAAAHILSDQLESELPFGECAFTWLNLSH